MVDWNKDPEPSDLRWEEEGTVVGITWDDGHDSRYRLEYLRQVCPCAQCRGAHDEPPIRTTPAKPFQILNDVQVQMARGASTVKSAEPVGHYAICFHWADGHNDGIYSYRFLRAMCPCEACSAKLAQTPAESEVAPTPRTPRQQAQFEAAQREAGRG